MRAVAVVILSLLCMSCATPTYQQIQMSLDHTNRVWKAENQGFIREHGSRYFDLPPATTYAVALSTLNRLGFAIEREDRKGGTIYAVAQAPSPLTDEEWEKARELDEPQFKKICSAYIGHWSSEAKLHVDGVEIQVIVAVLPKDSGSVVGFRFQMMDHKLSMRGYRPVTAPPPNVTKLAVYKAWLYFDKAIRSLPKKPKPTAQRNNIQTS